MFTKEGFNLSLMSPNSTSGFWESVPGFLGESFLLTAVLTDRPILEGLI